MDNKEQFILVVDDDTVVRKFICAKLAVLGYKTLEAQNGKECITCIKEQHERILTVLLDREMPEMDGMEVIGWLQNHHAYKHLPIIMLTGSGRSEQVKEGIDAGVFYYLTKPIDDEVLASVVAAALRKMKQYLVLSAELKKHREAFLMMNESHFRFHSLAEAEQLSIFLANCFQDSERVVPGLAELMINAIEHGNLGLHFKEKNKFKTQEEWRLEIERRQALPENKNKYVDVFFKRTEEGAKVVIEDQGEGFDWAIYLKLDPSRASERYGRGIAQANLFSFDKIIYNEKGNKVTGYILHKKKLNW